MFYDHFSALIYLFWSKINLIGLIVLKMIRFFFDKNYYCCQVSLLRVFIFVLDKLSIRTSYLVMELKTSTNMKILRYWRGLTCLCVGFDSSRRGYRKSFIFTILLYRKFNSSFSCSIFFYFFISYYFTYFKLQ